MVQVISETFVQEPTERVEKIREEFLRIIPSVSIERTRIETRILKETEGEPTITRRAKVFAATVRELPIYIFPDQLIVGCTSERPLCSNITPAINIEMRKIGQSYILGWRTDNPFIDLSDDEKRELAELKPYWEEQGRKQTTHHFGHNIHNHQKVVRKGFLGIKKEAEEKLSQLDRTNPEDAAKVPFLEGVIMVMEAAAEFGGRFASKARELAKEEIDEKRKKDLLKIAGVCERVPAHPARTFHEALQSYYFSYLLLFWEVVPSLGFSKSRGPRAYRLLFTCRKP
ncbi:MAG: pyruvate formate lyase family protein [Promethearchaeota archaeon]|jgi:formate C-acetyltransferase